MSNYNEQTSIRGKIPSNPILSDNKKKGYVARIGLNYPLQSSSKGYFSKQVGDEVIKSNLRQLLLTEPGERVMLPDFGCPLKAFLFAPLDEETFFLMKEQIVLAINKYLPTVQILRLGVYPESDYGKAGVPALKINLWCKILDNTDSTFEVSVEL